MRIMFNGSSRELDGGPAATATLEMVLRRLGFAGAVVATALNGEFVPAGARADRPVRDGDRVEVLAPMQGG